VSKPESTLAQVLSLRRLAEAEAHAALRTARSQVERTRLELQRARALIFTAEKQLADARATARSLAFTARSAFQLGCESDDLLAKAEQVRLRTSATVTLATELSLRTQQFEQARTDWLSCVARREAAELHDARERREQRRTRAQRERGHEGEAQHRFAGAVRVK
jgi:hypothetical protein